MGIYGLVMAVRMFMVVSDMKPKIKKVKKFLS